MSGFRKLASQTAIYGLSSILGRVLNYLLFPLYTRVFSEGEYGVVTELYAYVAFLLVLLTYGMETAFFRFAAAEKDPKEQDRIFSTVFLTIACTTSLFILLGANASDQVAGWIGYASHPEYISWFVWIVALDVLATVPMARLRLLNKPFAFVGINLGHIGLNMGLNLFFFLYCPTVANRPDAWLYPLVQAVYHPSIGIGYIFISNLLSSIFKLAMLIPWLGAVKYGISLPILRKLLPYALPLLVLGLAGIVNETFDRAFFTELSGLPPDEARAQLGIYGACYKVSMLLSIGIQAYRFAAEPFLFAGGASAQAVAVQAQLMKYYIIAATFIALGMICFLDLVMLMVGPAFREGAGVVPILLGAYILYGVVFNLSFWYKLHNKTGYGALIAMAGAAVTIMANMVLLPRMGYYGAAWATLAAYGLMALLSWWLGKKHHPVPYPLKAIVGYVLLAVVLWQVVKRCSFTPYARYMAGAAAMTAFAIAVMYFEKPLKRLSKP
jgi:O-antigen/teichoic acid export membrane protein